MDEGMKQDLERVSALADGALHGEAFARAVGDLGVREDLRREWQVAHLVGDVLRSGTHAPCSDSAAFLARLRERLAAEAAHPGAAQPVPGAELRMVRAEAANEPVFRWKVAAGVASVAAAAAIGWAWMGQGGTAPAGAQLARSTPQLVVPGAAGQPSVLAAATQGGQPARSRVVIGNGAPQIMLRDPRLDELLQAHQQASGASNMPSGFLRNATFEGPSR